MCLALEFSHSVLVTISVCLLLHDSLNIDYAQSAYTFLIACIVFYLYLMLIFDANLYIAGPGGEGGGGHEAVFC